MTIHSITFAQPAWLLVGLAVAAALLVLGVRLDRRRRAALASFGSRRAGAMTSLSRPRRIVKRALVVVGMLAACVALARPQHGYRWEEAQRRGIDLLFAIDTSKSMRAPDLKPDRLTRAKLAVADLVAKFEGDRVGLVAFAGDAFLQCPLTLDRDMFGQTLDAVDTSLIARGGTDVGRAIEVARAALRNQPANQKILVFLTDGEDLEAHAIDAARAAAADGVRIFTVGVGTAAGELVPLGDGADGRFVRDQAGAFVRSRLDERTLRAMASVTGGDYRQLGTDGRGLEALYQDVLAKLPRESLVARTRRVPLERFQWPLALALACLALEPLIRERRRARALEPAPPPPNAKLALFARRAAAVAALLLALGGARRAQASPADSRLQYNDGAAAYKAGDLPRAKAAFARALRSERLDVQENSYYDLGNTLFRDGQRSVQQEPDKTIAEWKKAIASYESAIQLNRKDADAIFNRDLVKRRLAQLEPQQKQKQADNDKQPKNQQGQSQKQKSQPESAQNAPGSQGGSGGNGQQTQKQEQAGQGGGQPQPGQLSPDQKQPGQAQNQPQHGQAPAQQPQTSSTQAAQDPPPAGRSPHAGPARGAKPGPATPAQASAGGEPSQEAGAAASSGQLSRNDARNLLDALRGDERILSAPAGDERATHQNVVNGKDW